MSILRPATPGFLVTLTATILLALVTFGVPINKSVFFLKASLTVENIDGSILLGTLGYCLELNNGTSCTKPAVGYSFDPNKLVGDNISFAQIPQVVVKWITYALVLHIAGLVLAAISAFLGLLAHVREFAMTCFSSCISGFAAAITLVAFIFDLVFFFVVKARINSVQNGSATIGNAVWLTLGAWVLLFFSGCFYGIGRCCIRNRPRAPRGDKIDDTWNNASDHNRYAEQVRLDAVKAEADRKARQKQGEMGLPAFQEHQPLNDGPQYLEEDEEPYRDNLAGAAGVGAAGPRRTPSGGPQFRGGYAQAPPGTRAVDEYYSPSRQEENTYPPPPVRQTSPRAAAYAPPVVAAAVGNNYTPTGAPSHNQYLSTAAQNGHGQYPSAQDYGHNAGGSSYYTASHQQYPTDQSQYGGYQNTSAYDSAYDYNAVGNTTTPGFPSHTPTPAPEPEMPTMPPARGYSATSSQYYTPNSYSGNYSNGYGSNVVPALDHSNTTSSYYSGPSIVPTSSPSPINTTPNTHFNVATTSALTTRSPVRESLSDLPPPSYEAGPSHVPPPEKGPR